MATSTRKHWWAPRLAAAAWSGLIVLCVAWELVVAPLHPGGSWLVMKALPLLVLAPGVLRWHPKTLQWGLLLVPFYAAEAVVRLGEPAPHAWLAAIEFALGASFYVAAIAILHPLKKAARLARRHEA